MGARPGGRGCHDSGDGCGKIMKGMEIHSFASKFTNSRHILSGLFRFNMIRIVTIQYDANCYNSYDSQYV